VSGLRVDRVVTHGIFSIDGEDFEVDNNIWLVGDDDEVLIIDAAHDHAPIVGGVSGRQVSAIVCTHGHNDHLNAAVALADATGAPVWLHADDRMLWDDVHPDRAPDHELVDGHAFTVAGAPLVTIHTPGHSPGGCCLHAVADLVLFSGDTLFNGGPGATGRSFSSFDDIIASISNRLLDLPPATVVHTGHGDDTSIGAEAPHLDEWIARGG
jgi:glyoxylase-like metal-dependent hydrolase (beta-lactamase superfamily II)